jgi:hypothetical protein
VGANTSPDAPGERFIAKMSCVAVFLSSMACAHDAPAGRTRETTAILLPLKSPHGELLKGTVALERRAEDVAIEVRIHDAEPGTYLVELAERPTCDRRQIDHRVAELVARLGRLEVDPSGMGSFSVRIDSSGAPALEDATSETPLAIAGRVLEIVPLMRPWRYGGASPIACAELAPRAIVRPDIATKAPARPYPIGESVELEDGFRGTE